MRNGRPQQSRTPLQELILEVLAARYRLGEQTWTFTRSATVTSAVRTLEIEGLLTFKPGTVRDTYLVVLTDSGKAAVLDPDYQLPLTRAVAAAVAPLNASIAALTEEVSTLTGQLAVARDQVAALTESNATLLGERSTGS